MLAKAAELKGGKVANARADLESHRQGVVPQHQQARLPQAQGRAGQDRANLTAFSPQVRDIFEKFKFEPEIARLEENNRLFLVVSKFVEIDLHPNAVSDIEMGYVFEELIRRFNEAANETAGDHFTPREVIRLMVNIYSLPTVSR